MRKRLLKLTVALIGLGTLLSFGQVFAADSDVNGVIISPPLTEKQADPGSLYSGTVKVTNPNANADLAITVSTEDFTAKGEDGQQTFIDPAENNSSYSLAKWLTISEKSFTLKANESKTVNYTINVPQVASPGGHYGVIFFSPTLASGAQANSNSVLAIPKVGALILFTVPGAITYNGKISSFETGKKSGDTFAAKKIFINSNNVIDYLTKFQNSSTNHVKPLGDLIIKNMFGKEVSKLKVNDKEGNVLPDSVRKFENQSEIKHGFGLYNASVTLAYGDNKNATATLTFWIVPWKETAGAVVIIIILIWVFRNISWKRKNKNQNANTEPPVNNQPKDDQPVNNQPDQRINNNE